MLPPFANSAKNIWRAAFVIDPLGGMGRCIASVTDDPRTQNIRASAAEDSVQRRIVVRQATLRIKLDAARAS
jgi:hypothetical protein